MEILSPAKINLFLHITGKRPDGYHNLISLMCCVDLYDTLLLDFNSEYISVTCCDPNVPRDKSNLAFKAADIFLKILNKNGGVHISIDKQIPVAAGLGGGSSNAAAVLLGLNRYYDKPFSPDELVAMALTIGADVPFFILQKPAIATGIGTDLEPYENLKPLNVLLVSPNFSVSTAEIYKNYNLGLTKCKKKLSLFSFKNKDFDIAHHLCNDLESVTNARYPEIITLKEALFEHGAKGGLMSGSGPTVFGLFNDLDKAQKAKQALAQNHNWRIFLTRMIV